MGDCIKCGGDVEGWYKQRWYGVYPGPVCQRCWVEKFPVPGYPDEPGGVDYPEEAEPAFHIYRYRRIKALGDG